MQVIITLLPQLFQGCILLMDLLPSAYCTDAPIDLRVEYNKEGDLYRIFTFSLNFSNMTSYLRYEEEQGQGYTWRTMSSLTNFS